MIRYKKKKNTKPNNYSNEVPNQESQSAYQRRQIYVLIL